MKRRLAYNKSDNKIVYIKKDISNNYFNGTICLIKYVNVVSPLIVEHNNIKKCIYDNGYEWLRIYPSNEHYTFIAMYNEKKELVEWYFDVAKEIGKIDGIPYHDDLYLDVIINSKGEYLLLDEEELKNASDINEEDYKLAYDTVKRIKELYVYNFNYLKELTNSLYNIIKE